MRINLLRLSAMVVMMVALLALAGPALARPLQLRFAPPQIFGAHVPQAITSADFNGDTRPDLATGNYTNSAGSSVSVLINDGSGRFGMHTNFAAGTLLRGITSADLNGDDNQDIATANTGSSNVSVLLGNGSGGFTAPTNLILTNNAFPWGIVSADFNDDSKPDLATANQGLNNVSVLINNGSGGFASPVNLTVGSISNTTLGITSTDFNGDRKADLAATTDSSKVAVLLGDGSGGFGTVTKFNAGSGSQDLITADFNRDGKPDLATANPFSDDVSVLLGDGLGGFATSKNFKTGDTPRHLTGADFNRDGKTDLAVSNDDSENTSVLLGNGSGSFGAPKNFGAGDFVGGVTSANLNADTKPDLAVANATSSVSVLINNSKKKRR